MNKFMKMAINEARLGIKNNHGGPFGSVIVKGDKVIAKGHNQVLKNNDPTCHGEIDAIRKCSHKLNTYDLTGCILYTTGEPCDMCLSACMWANISKIYYGATIKDNSKLGFRDQAFNKYFNKRQKLKNYLINIDRDECLALFNDYQKTDNIKY
jgi:guanine deaminase